MFIWYSCMGIHEVHLDVHSHEVHLDVHYHEVHLDVHSHEVHLDVHQIVYLSTAAETAKTTDESY